MGTTAAVVAVVVVIVCASVGQALTTHLGNKLRRYITWSPARALDATGGALVNVVAMLLVAWLIGSALAGTTLPTLGKEVRGSKVLLGVSRALPDQADIWFADFSSVLAQNGFPQVFSPFANEPITDVSPPDPALAGSPVAARAQRSIVKVTGTATSCGKVLEGTGFVFDDRRVMTNAHVVGGVDEPVVQIGGEGRRYDATVVLYDWKRDIAVLDVPDLDAPVLRFAAEDASSGDSAIVAGFPENGAYDVRAARLRGRITANGPDIYHRGTVRRDVYSLFATVRQGNSGGPLLTPRARSTASSSRSRWTTPRRDTRSPWTRSARTSPGAAAPPRRSTATSARSEREPDRGADGTSGTVSSQERPDVAGPPGTAGRTVSRVGDAAGPTPSARGGGECAGCRP